MKIVFRPETPGFLDLSLTPFTGPLEDESLLAPRIFVDGSPVRVVGKSFITGTNSYRLFLNRNLSPGQTVQVLVPSISVLRDDNSKILGGVALATLLEEVTDV